MKKTVLIVWLLAGANLQAKECIPWPEIFAKAELAGVSKQTILIQIDPFQNDTGQKGDAWMETGLPWLLARYWNSFPNVRAVTRSTSGPRFKITGMFQSAENWLRVFVQLKEPSGKLLGQFPMETPFPLHKRFFEGMRETAEQIAKKMGMEKIPSEALLKIQNETGNVHAFANAARGYAALQTYDRHQIEVALIWFQEARREDYKYLQAYQGLLDSYHFLLLHQRQSGEGAEPVLEALTQTRAEMKRRGLPVEEEDRFVQAHVHWISAAKALSAGKPKSAAEALTQAWKLVPEAPLTAYHLAQTYATLGNKKEAARWRSQAEAMNRCLTN